MAITASADGSTHLRRRRLHQVSGQSRAAAIAALDAQTGAVIAGFNPGANTRVEAIAVNGNTLYFGGDFTTVGGQAAVTRLAGRATRRRARSFRGLRPPTAVVDAMVVHPAERTRHRRRLLHHPQRRRSHAA